MREEILNKLISLNVNTITKTATFAKGKTLQSLRLNVNVPYFFLTLFDDSLLNTGMRKKSTIGYIKINGITTLILYIPNGRVNLDSASDNYKFTTSLTLSDSDKIEIWHKPTPKNPQNQDTTAQTSIIDELTALSEKPSNVYYWDYAMAHPSVYIYKSVLENDTRFNDYKYFRLYCTLLFIAEKSNIIKHHRQTCHITSTELLATLPDSYKYEKQTKDKDLNKNLPERPDSKKQYSKTFIKFLDSARREGLIERYAHHGDYIAITFTNAFLAPLSAPPYAKVPIFLIQNEINKYNYRFMLYFILRQMRNNPNKPYFIKIKIQELLSIIGIGKHTSHTIAADRLNAYMAILANYGVVHHPQTYTAKDIRKNTLISFRMYKFKTSSLIPDVPEDSEEDYNLDSDEED